MSVFFCLPIYLFTSLYLPSFLISIYLFIFAHPLLIDTRRLCVPLTLQLLQGMGDEGPDLHGARLLRGTELRVTVNAASKYVVCVSAFTSMVCVSTVAFSCVHVLLSVCVDIYVRCSRLFAQGWKARRGSGSDNELPSTSGRV
eukprot:GHVU01068629.1.p1 GENE.GHVU01068629.1~~GHVU01068629.1.p1  ORF type:complete len:143 (-),score=4.52 GHVU01068629.1:294-722(-)